MVGSMYMVGMFFGGLMIGRICDVFGRRFGTSLSVLIGSISHFGAGWATNYYTYVSARFLSGLGYYLNEYLFSFHNTFKIRIFNMKYLKHDFFHLKVEWDV